MAILGLESWVVSPAVDLSVLASVVYVVLSTLSSWLHDWRLRRKHPECKEPPRHKNRLPFGIDMAQDCQNAYNESKLLRFLQLMLEKYGGTFRYTLLGANDIWTSEPENVQAMLATNFQDYELGHRNMAFFPMLGDGIFTTDGKVWEHSRALLKPQFARAQISDLDMTERHVQQLIKVIRGRMDNKGEVDLHPLFHDLTMDTATEFLFGESVDVQATEPGVETDGTRFQHAFDGCQYYMMTRYQLKAFGWMYKPKVFRQQCKTIHSYVDAYVDRYLALKRQKANREKEKEPQTGRKKYIFLEALTEVTQDKAFLRYNVLHILLAGRDTTASMLSWIFYLLARHKRVWYKLREEVLKSFGPDPNAGEKPTFESMKRCKYLQWVINETFRIEPVVSLNGRKAIRDTVLPVGGGPDGRSPILVKKGTAVDYLPFAMQRRKDYWGPDAEIYRPERWGEDSVRAGPNSVIANWKFIPFNGGPRICIGQQFALTEVSYVTIRLIQEFADIDIAVGERGYNTGGGIEHDAGINFLALTMISAEGCKLKLTPA